MADQICNQCGAHFEDEAAQGLCPCCLLDSAVKLADTSQSENILTAPDEGRTPETAGPPAFGDGQRLGDYELLEQVGQGGMGVIYRARQISLNRVVAVKMLLAGEFATKAAMHRFRTEAEAAACLHHPNIVSIHEAGEQDGRLFFSMDFVDGQTLAELVRETPLTPRQAARYTQTAALAVHYAHSKGILHRDLKPGNVLIDEAGELRITDFGLAKRFEVPSSSEASVGTDSGVSPLPSSERTPRPEAERTLHPTLSGQVMGSPSFMPPEQASARWGTVGPWSDVYGLGALLYYLLTARPPFHAATVTDTLEQVVHNEPGLPRVLNPSVPVDLETICLRCLEKEPVRRYGSMQEVADELARFLQGEPIRARPLGPWDGPGAGADASQPWPASRLPWPVPLC